MSAMLLPLTILCALFTLSKASITDRLAAAGIEYTIPSDAIWDNFATPFNRRLSYKPKVIAWPDNAEQVSAAIKAGHAEKLRVTAKSGGHSYTAYSLGGEDNHLVLDLRRLNTTAVTGKTAKVQPGTLLGDLALSLNEQGASAIPHGVCPYVGIGGHATFGGFGMASRMWGLALDNILSIEAVLASGDIVTLSNQEYAPLFKAFRGAGASFGVITAFTFQLKPQPPSVTVYSYQWNLDAATAADAFAAWQTFGLSNPTRDLGGELNLAKGSTAGTVAVSFHGAFYGPQTNFEAAVTPFLKTMPTPSGSTVTPGDYMASVTSLAGKQKLSSSNIPANGEHDTFYAKSIITYQKSPISKDALTAFANYLAGAGYSSSLNWFAQLELYGGKSAINDDPEGGTSFAHRDALWTIQFYASTSNYAPPFPDSGFTFVDDMVSSIVSHQPSDWPYGAYTNYVDDRLTTSQWQQQYYGSEYKTLQYYKSWYDPDNVFGFPQSITLEKSSRRKRN